MQIRTTFTPITRNARLGQQNTETNSSWSDETRQMLLQNPETGSYYIPTSSGSLLILGTARFDVTLEARNSRSVDVPL